MYFKQISTAVILALATVGNATPLVARQSNSGQATFYNPGGGTGSCGNSLSGNSMGVALPMQYGTNNCGKNVKIQMQGGGSVSAPVVDSCESCDSNHIDLLPGVFSALGASESSGVVPITWSLE